MKVPLHIGTSGWRYGRWKGPFYPEDLGDEAGHALRAALRLIGMMKRANVRNGAAR